MFIILSLIAAGIVVWALVVALRTDNTVTKIVAAFVAVTIALAYYNTVVLEESAGAATTEERVTVAEKCADSCTTYSAKRVKAFKAKKLGNSGGKTVPKKVRKALNKWHANHRPASRGDAGAWWAGVLVKTYCIARTMSSDCGGPSQQTQDIVDVSVVCGGSAALAILAKGAGARTADVYGLGASNCAWQAYFTWYKYNR